MRGPPQSSWPLTEGEQPYPVFQAAYRTPRIQEYGTTSPGEEDRSLIVSLLPKRLAIFIPLSSLLRATTRDGHSADLADNGGAEVSTTPRGRRTTIIIPDNPKRQFLPPKRRIGTLFLIQPTFDGQSSLRLDRIPLSTILKKVGV